MAVTESGEALALLAESTLSAANPEATREQRDLEIMALRMYGTTRVQKAKHEAAAFWLERPVPHRWFGMDVPGTRRGCNNAATFRPRAGQG